MPSRSTGSSGARGPDKRRTGRGQVRRGPARPATSATGRTTRSARPSGPTGSRGGATRSTPRPSSARTGTATRPAPAAGAAASGGRTRLTGRAAVLVLVVAVLAVSYASSLKAYLQQRAHITDLQSTIAERQDEISDLTREKRRWDDPQYVEAQARERLGYVMPGETPFVVVQDGQPLQSESELGDPVVASEAAPWWQDAWDSVQVAGDPPTKADPLPARKVADPEGAPDDSTDDEDGE
ncbi:MAG: septum formation initiator [Nocardioides sp.]|nr:septum formation initiator [Nocardioides sp.]